MATYPQSGSLLSSGTNSSLSTQITVKVGPTTVGAIQQLTINQNRQMHTWEEIGTDGIVEIHPKGAAKISLTVNRIVFDELRLPEAFARGFINIQSQRIPFDIQIIDKSRAVTDQDALVHVFNNCWFTGYSPSFTAEKFIISESANIACEYVTSHRKALSAVLGGLRGISLEHDTIERTTDVTGRQGRLDSAGSTVLQRFQ